MGRPRSSLASISSPSKPLPTRRINYVRRLLIRRLAPQFQTSVFRFGLAMRKATTQQLGGMLYET